MTNAVLFIGLIIMSALAVLQPNASMVLFVVLVLLFGIPHGALDLWIIYHFKRSSAKKMFLLGIGYVTLSGFVFLVFYLWPTFMLILFLAYSAIHFGMDYAQPGTENNQTFVYLVAFLCGLGLISFPAIFHQLDVSQLFSLLISQQSAFKMSLILHHVAIGLALAILLFGWKAPIKKRGELVFALIIALVAPPIAFLTVYFLGLHSRNHFLLLYQKLHYKSRIRFIKDLIPITLLSYLLAITIYFFLLPGLTVESKAFATVIYLLAALTLPHLIIVEVFRNKN